MCARPPKNTYAALMGNSSRPPRIYMPRPLSEVGDCRLQKMCPGGWLVPRSKSMTKKPAISSAQIRAARALLNWSARQLSERSGVSQSSISRAERGKGPRSMHQQSLVAVKATFERYGVEFLDDSGVRLRSEGRDHNQIEPARNNPHGVTQLHAPRAVVAAK